MTDVTSRFVLRWSHALRSAFAEHAEQLGALDRIVGDGDHGETMRRAFAEAARQTSLLEPELSGQEDVKATEQLLLRQGRAILDAGGGASGPLMASVFIGLSQQVGTQGAMTGSAFAHGLQEAVDLVKRMGRTELGDKTLLDAMQPAAEAAVLAAAKPTTPLLDVWQEATHAARKGCEATANMSGRRGRAAWVEGKGVGTPDPGATSFTLILSTGLRLLENDGASAPESQPEDRANVRESEGHGYESAAHVGVGTAPPGKFLNDPRNAVDEMIDGFVAAFRERIARVEGTTIVTRKVKKRGKVGLVIGNGSGHEPIAMGWVGEGMLDANAVGPIFTAPSPNLLAQAIAEADTGAGVLLLVSHHAGDRIASEMAAQLARVEGHDVETLIMYDDVASAPKGREPERRGGPGTTFIYKIVGQALEEGATLDEALALGTRIRDATRTLSVALAPGTSPLTGEPMFSLPEGEAFIGMGVHGEPGFARVPATSVNEICSTMVQGILADAEYPTGVPLIAIINGSGGTSLMELLVATRAVVQEANSQGHQIVHPLIGSYVTTQETKGFSVSFFHPSEEADLSRWLAPTNSPFFQL